MMFVSHSSITTAMCSEIILISLGIHEYFTTSNNYISLSFRNILFYFIHL
jgi:hypothetical protein